MTEDEGADRTCDKANKINAKRVERRGQWVFVREEELAEDEACHRAVQEKIVPLDRGSYRCGDDGATELATMLAWRERIVGVSHGYHCRSSPGRVVTSAFPPSGATGAAFHHDHAI